MESALLVGRIGGISKEEMAMPKPYSADLRERVLLADEAGLSPTEVAARFGIGVSTVYLWRQQARAEARRYAKPQGGGRARGSTRRARRSCRRWWPSATIARWTNTGSFGGTHRAGAGQPTDAVPRAAAARAAAQKKTLRASEQDRADIQEERAVFCERVRQIDPEELVFIDESGITTALTRLYARAPHGARARGSAPAAMATADRPGRALRRGDGGGHEHPGSDHHTGFSCLLCGPC